MTDTRIPQLQYFEIERPLVEWLEHPACLQRLCQHWPAEEVGRLAADMYFAPLAWQPRYSRYDRRPQVILSILRAAIERWPPSDIVARIERRLIWLLQHPFGTGWVREQLPPAEQLPAGMQPFAGIVQSVATTDNSFAPTVAHCLDLLAALPDSRDALMLTDRFLSGELNFGPHETPHWRRSANDVPVYAYTAYPIGHQEALSSEWAEVSTGLAFGRREPVCCVVRYANGDRCVRREQCRRRRGRRGRALA